MNAWEPALPQVHHLPKFLLFFNENPPSSASCLWKKKAAQNNSHVKEPTTLFEPTSELSEDEAEVYELNFPSSPIEIQ